MKIGILTYHCVPNFGAQLQTLSTVCYLRNQGHEPIVLHWYPADLKNIYKWIDKAQIAAHDDFSAAYLPLSALCETEDELIDEIDKLQLDAILLGSDALFKYVPLLRRVYLKKGKRRPHLIIEKVPSVERIQGNPFFGGFISKLHKQVPVSVYAVSAQNTSFNLMTFMEKYLMKSGMCNFRFVSVRDEWTREMVESVMNVSKIDIYPDPVFAFNNNALELIPSKEYILEKYSLPKNYVLLSFRTGMCSDEYIQSLALALRSKGMSPIALTMPEGVNCAEVKPEIDTPLSPMDWYALIKHSNGYIGERMHPIVVAMHNCVPCFSFDEYGASLPDKVIFPRYGKWDKGHSKIYHIMHSANLLSNWFAYGSNQPLPDPQYIVESILSFDKKICEDFINQQYIKYEEGMQKVLVSFT